MRSSGTSSRTAGPLPSRPASRRGRLFCVAAAGGLALWAGLLGCAAGPTRPADAGLGKATFEDRCSACHWLPGPEEYTAVEWRGIIRQMAPQAGLDPDERQDVLAYLLSECGGEAEARK